MNHETNIDRYLIAPFGKTKMICKIHLQVYRQQTLQEIKHDLDRVRIVIDFTSLPGLENCVHARIRIRERS